MNDPIDKIEWLPYSQLDSNDYNPNVVFNTELKLLELSVLSSGWVQPILVRARSFKIIDGFHRWMLTKESKALNQKYGGLCPCAVLDVTDAQAMLMTIRMNRAKGTHVALRMAEIMRRLVENCGMTIEQIAPEIGASVDEVRILYQDDIFKERKLTEYRYSKAWIPAEGNHE